MDYWKWVTAFTLVDSLNRIFYGMYVTLLGPSQPYLAHRVNVDLDTIAWIQPFANVSALMGAVVSGLVFKRHFQTSRMKLAYILGCTLLLALASVLPLYTRTLSTLVLVVSFRQFLALMLETPCQGMYVYTLGPHRSQAFIMMFHCTVGMGFLLGPVLIEPFFPSRSPEYQSICNQTEHSSHNSAATEEDLEAVIESIKWPFWIMLYGHGLCALGYLAIMISPLKMPVYYTAPKNSDTHAAENINFSQERNTIIPIVLLYMASCGSERLFQTMEFTFGLCGPLRLAPKKAVVTDQCYNGGFFAGRLASVVAVKLATPKSMLQTSLGLCLISTCLLSLQADKSADLLYLCAAIFGFAISWQFGSAYSWASHYLDVVGVRASIFPIGCSLSFVAPMAGAYLFRRLTPMSVWHLNLLLVSTQIFAFVRLRGQFESKAASIRYTEISQDDS